MRLNSSSATGQEFTFPAETLFILFSVCRSYKYQELKDSILVNYIVKKLSTAVQICNFNKQIAQSKRNYRDKVLLLTL